jgi:hypothetical protein
LIDLEVERLYRAGTQRELESYANRCRILSFCSLLNHVQIKELGLFLRVKPRKDRQEEFEELRQLSADLNSLVNSEKYSDVVLTVQGDKRQVRTQRAFLAARAPVFEKKIESIMSDSTKKQTGGPVALEIDAPYTAALAAVQWIMTGRLDLTDFEAIDVCKLLVLADEYKMESLKNLCEKELTEKVSLDTVFTSLLHINKEVSQQVYDTCIRFAIESAAEFKTQPEYGSLTREHYRDLFENATK